MDKNFERELPKGYKLAKCIDVKSGSKSVWIVMLLSLVFVIPGCIFIALALIFKSDEISKAYDKSPIAFLMVVLLGYLLYIILHELEHGRVYKKLTGEKLTFGINPLCAFCGVPKIFTYRKTALKAVSAPLILYSAIFTVLILSTLFVFPLFSFGVSILFAFHLSGCAGDIYVIWLFKKQYTDNTVLMNDTGPTMSLFVYDINTTEEEERIAREHFERVTRKEPSEEKSKRIEKKSKAISVTLICIFSIFLIAHILILFFGESSDIKFGTYEPAFYQRPSLWIALAYVGIIAFCSLTIKKYYLLKDIGGALIIIFSIPLISLSLTSPFGADIAYTNDVDNYGIYNSYDGWMPELFPKEITEDMTPIYYSYYHDMVMDGVMEVYLEVKMTDSAYNALKSQYAEQMKKCWYDENYSEYVKCDKFFVYKDQGYCDRPDVRKIIFNDTEKIVIFEYMYGIDPMHFENIYYFERFNINGKEYSDKLEALHESN